MIIDVRCRVTIPEAGSYFVTTLKAHSVKKGRYEQIQAYREGTIEAFFHEIGEYGITTAVSVSGNNPGIKIGSTIMPDRTTSNDLMAQLQREHWGRFIGVAGIDAGNVFHNAIDEIERCHQLGLRGVFIEPGRSPGCNLDDRRLYPIYEKCVERDMTLFPQTSGPKGAKNIDYANPKAVDQVAEDFPDLRIICGHGCYPYVREAIVVAVRRDNVYMSPDAYILELGTEDWLKAVNQNIRGFQDKFLFGSAYPLQPLKPVMEAYDKLPWNREVLPKIFYKNALRALKLEDDPTFKEMYKM